MGIAKLHVVLCALTLLSAAATLAQGMGTPGGAMPNIPERDAEKKKEYTRYERPASGAFSGDVDAARTRSGKVGVLQDEAPASGKIFEIRVEGVRRVEADAVLVQLGTRVGTTPSRDRLREDVRRVHRMGLFADVTVISRPGPQDSIILIFRLVEKPAVGNILFEGNDDVGTDDLKEVVDIKAYQILDVARVRGNVAKLQKLYVDKGYFLAEVTYALRPSTGPKNPDGRDEDEDANLYDALVERLKKWWNRNEPPADSTAAAAAGDTKKTAEDGRFVDVVFIASEQAKVKVESIQIVGNDAMPEDDLTEVLRTRENHPAGVFTEWGTYKQDLADVDLLALESVYADRGYINVNVGKPRLTLSADKTRLALHFPVVEGEQYRVHQIDVDGDLVVTSAEERAAILEADADAIPFEKTSLSSRIKTKGGSIFSRSEVFQDLVALSDRYRDRGYAFVNVVPETQPVEGDDKALDVLFRVQSGPRVRIERIEITGNTKTQDVVVRREMRVYEGEWFSASSLRLSEQRVNALGFFETVSVTTRQGSAPDRIVVVFDVKERSTGTFQVGAGFSGAESFLLQAQIAQNNFLGRGVTMSVNGQLSPIRQIIDVRYIDPYAFYVFQEPLTLSFSAFLTQRSFFDFARNSTGSDVTIGYPLGRPFRGFTERLLEDAPDPLRPYMPDLENLQLFVSAAGERVEIGEQSFAVRLLGLTAHIPRYTTAIRTSLTFDQRNNRLFPSQGWFFQASAEIASPWLGAGLMPSAETAAKDALVASGLLDQPIGMLRAGLLKRGGIANDFQRYAVVGQAYYSFDDWLPINGVVLKGKVEAGWLVTKDPTLIFERYFLGGFNTMRGYFPRSIAPVQRVGGLSPDGALQAFRVGGDKQFLTNLELEFPILEQVGVRGVVFFDTGNTFGPDENFFYLGNGLTPSLQALRCGAGPCWDPRDRANLPLGLFTSVGVGIRWFSPFGPLRFEWGVPLNRRPAGTFGFTQGDEPVFFEFNIGNSF